jgi:hypothetical protein
MEFNRFEAREIVMNVRRTWKSLKWLAVIVCGMAITPVSHGGIVYQYVTDSSNYTTATPGSTIDVKVYLKETLTSGSTSIITGDGGLFGAGMTLVRSATGLPNSPSGFVTDATGFTFNLTDFGGPTKFTGADGQGNPAATGVAFLTAVSPSNPNGVPLGNTGGGVSPSIANEVYLGTVHILAGSDNGVTTFNLRVHDNGFGNTITNGSNPDFTPYDLDVSNNGGSTPPAAKVYTGASQSPSSFTVTVGVPEPTSMGLLLGVGAFGLIRRRRS